MRTVSWSRKQFICGSEIFSFFQGLLPYSGQLMISTAFAVAAGHSLSAVSFMPYVWYSYLLGVFGILSIFIPFADGPIRRKPWDWGENEIQGDR